MKPDKPFVMFFRCRLCGEVFETDPEAYADDRVRTHKCSNGNRGYADALGYMELFKI